MISGKITEFKISDEMQSKIDAIQNVRPSKVIVTDEQKAIILKYYEKKNKEELAKLLGMSYSTLKSIYKKLSGGVYEDILRT